MQRLNFIATTLAAFFAPRFVTLPKNWTPMPKGWRPKCSLQSCSDLSAHIVKSSDGEGDWLLCDAHYNKVVRLHEAFRKADEALKAEWAYKEARWGEDIYGQSRLG